MKRFVLFIVVIFSVSSPVLAWHDAGHKIIAAIAFRRLNESQQQAVVALLKRHPRFEQEFAKKMPEGLDQRAAGEWIFGQAAVFPDIARQYRDELKEKFHHSTWHYLDLPEFLSPADRAALEPEDKLNSSLLAPDVLPENANIVQVIRFSRRALANKSGDVEQQAILVPWLMHTVGDIHQPLHSTALYSQRLFPEGDRGGNSVLVGEKSNLHSVWDGFPGGRVDFPTVDRRTITFLADPALVELGMAAAQDLEAEHWLLESHRLACADVYTADVLATLRTLEDNRNAEKARVELSEDYYRRGAAVSEKRVVEAGFRLGAILSELFE